MPRDGAMGRNHGPRPTLRVPDATGGAATPAHRLGIIGHTRTLMKRDADGPCCSYRANRIGNGNFARC